MLARLLDFVREFDSRCQLILISLSCAILWRVELYRFYGLDWIGGFHFAIPIGMGLCLLWGWRELREFSNRRKMTFFCGLLTFGIGILMILEILLIQSYPGRFAFPFDPFFVIARVLLIVLWISIPLSTFFIYTFFIPITKEHAIVGCLVFWFSWALALLLLAITPGRFPTDLIHTIKSGFIIPPIIFGLGWPLVMRERTE